MNSPGWSAALLQVIVNGLLVGGVYALSAAGLNLVFGVLKVANIAHGDFMMLGAMTAYAVSLKLGLSPYIAMLVAAAVLVGVGALTQRFLVERVIGSPMFVSLLLLYAVSMVLRNGALQVWGPTYVSLAHDSTVWTVGPLSLSEVRVVVFALGLGLTLALLWLLQKTAFGQSLRATAQHMDLAEACGINVRRVRMQAFALGTALAAMSGALLIMLFSVNPSMGEVFVLKGFAIVVIGGLGSFFGAFTGAMIIGVAETLTSFYATTQLADVTVFLIFLIVLIFRPSGVLGGRAT
ncbi:MAG: branched-chain amino acid ABC transporter permease [Bacillota bacterium]